MKISFKGDYVLKIILDLSLVFGKGIRQIKEIAQKQDIPEKFLEQIITTLKGAGYVKTIRGAKGGVLLAKDPAEITLGEIIRLIDGPTSPIACVSITGCNFENRCAFRDVFCEIRGRINDIVDKTTFADMVEKTRQLGEKEALDYTI
jgi:Rrf2 family cysteine metabolism transcriptional repressor